MQMHILHFRRRGQYRLVIEQTIKTLTISGLSPRIAAWKNGSVILHFYWNGWRGEGEQLESSSQLVLVNLATTDFSFVELS